MTDNKPNVAEIVKGLDEADLFLRDRANAKPASLNEYDIGILLDIAKLCDEAAHLIKVQKAEIEGLIQNEK